MEGGLPETGNPLQQEDLRAKQVCHIGMKLRPEDRRVDAEKVGRSRFLWRFLWRGQRASWHEVVAFWWLHPIQVPVRL